MAVGRLINSCFQVTATQSLYQFPRVLLSMCRKLRASENSINFIIFGEKNITGGANEKSLENDGAKRKK